MVLLIKNIPLSFEDILLSVICVPGVSPWGGRASTGV
jgi:hypothetical protein